MTLRRILPVLVVVAASCARLQHEPVARVDRVAPSADSLTVALWHMDEAAGTRIADAGPHRLDGTAGTATRTGFGRFGNARSFERSLDSFVFVPYAPALESRSALTVEAWVHPRSFGPYEDTPLAGRWSEEANRQSWLFAIAGRRLSSPSVLPGPAYHEAIFPQAPAGHLLFAYQPEAAGSPRAFASAQAIDLNRWTHVAATFDGEIVKFYVDGLLDSQYATLGRIRASSCGLLVGHYFDTRYLTGFGGDLRVEPPGVATPNYGFDGWLDELRISSGARDRFPTVLPR